MFTILAIAAGAIVGMVIGYLVGCEPVIDCGCDASL